MPTPLLSPKNAADLTVPDSEKQNTVIVVAPTQDHAACVAASFATQGEPMQVLWFEESRQAQDACPQNALLVGVVLCHRAEQVPNGDLLALRRAHPNTPVLLWPLPHAA